MAQVQSAQDGVLIGHEAPSLIGPARQIFRRIVGKHQQRQGLVALTHHGDDALPWARPSYALDVEGGSQAGERGEDAFQKGAVPAVEAFPRIGGILETSPEKKEFVALHRSFHGMRHCHGR